MIALFSFWTKPHLFRAAPSYPSERVRAMAWLLSVERARTHVGRTRFVGDTPACQYMEDLGVPFDVVECRLDSIIRIDHRLWSYSKIVAMEGLEAPFVHLDSDLFAQGPMPAFEGYDVAFDYAEPVPGYDVYARPLAHFATTEQRRGGRLPPWVNPALKSVPNCGLILVNNPAWARFYVRELRAWVEGYGRSAVQRLVLQSGGYASVFVEQYFAGAAAHHLGLRMGYLSSHPAWAGGYSHHPSSGAKHNPGFVAWLDDTLCREYPRHYDRIQSLYGDA